MHNDFWRIVSILGLLRKDFVLLEMAFYNAKS